MKNVYIVKNIFHSGRKGERYTPVNDDYKYGGIIGYKVKFNPLKLERGKNLYMDVCASPQYSWWETSMVLATYIDKDKTLVVETENSIYEFEEVNI